MYMYTVLNRGKVAHSHTVSDEGFTRECLLVHTCGLAQVTCEALVSGLRVRTTLEASTHKTLF